MEKPKLEHGYGNRRLAAEERGRGRPPRSFFKALREANEEDYRSLASFCIEVIIEANMRREKPRIIIKHPYNFRRYSKDFPRGKWLKESRYFVWMEYKAELLLDYLHELGYSSVCSQFLRAELKAFKAYTRNPFGVNDMGLPSWAAPIEQLRFFENLVDNEKSLLDNVETSTRRQQPKRERKVHK